MGGRLNRRGVKHDADRGAERAGGEGVGELGADDTGVACVLVLDRRLDCEREFEGRSVFTVRAGDLAPDDADLGATDLLGGLVDVGDLLAEVEAVSSLATD